MNANKVYDTFRTMNKTVEVISLYEFYEYAPKMFKTTIDVELKNAAEFSHVPLLVEPSDGTIRVAEATPLLATFRETFQNVTRTLNLNPNLIVIDAENIEILFDQKPASAVAMVTGVDSPRLFTTANISSSSSGEPVVVNNNDDDHQKTTTSSVILTTLVAGAGGFRVSNSKSDVETKVEYVSLMLRLFFEEIEFEINFYKILL